MIKHFEGIKVRLKSNGCGVPYLKWLSPDFCFTGACDTHDVVYASGLLSRKDADKKFLKDMLIQARKQSRFVWFYSTVAYIYWIAVRAFGWIFYKRGIRR